MLSGATSLLLHQGVTPWGGSCCPVPPRGRQSPGSLHLSSFVGICGEPGKVLVLWAGPSGAKQLGSRIWLFPGGSPGASSTCALMIFPNYSKSEFRLQCFNPSQRLRKKTQLQFWPKMGGFSTLLSQLPCSQLFLLFFFKLFSSVVVTEQER